MFILTYAFMYIKYIKYLQTRLIKILVNKDDKNILCSNDYNKLSPKWKILQVESKAWNIIMGSNINISQKINIPTREQEDSYSTREQVIDSTKI